MSQTATQTFVLNKHKAMINNPSHSDLILLVGQDKKKIYSQKQLLSQFSEYFRAAFNENWKQNKTEDGKQVLELFDIDEETMMLILEYMYVASTDEICLDKVARVYRAADLLQLDNLMEVCEEKVDEGNAVELFKVAFTLQQFSFSQTCLDVLKPKLLEIEDEKVASLSTEMVHNIIVNFRNMFTDMEIWRFLEKYCKSFSLNNGNFDDASVEKAIVILESLTKSSFFFRFDQGQHAEISLSLLIATLNTNTASKLTSLLKHHLTKKRPHQLISSSAIFEDSMRYSFVINKVNEMINQSHGTFKRISWKLLFRASEHNFKAKAFHEHCDEKGPTITLVKANDRFAAAYNCESWIKAGKDLCCYKPNYNGFICSIEGDKFTKFHRYNNKIDGTTSHSEHGPIFGKQLERSLFLSSCDGNKYSYSCFGKSYIGNESAAQTHLFGSSDFFVQEYEVFSIEFD